jgi:NAD(P)H-hydrate repair Nnr-like enzyme with NAD(P)H-hydrate dehydratase domain
VGIEYVLLSTTSNEVLWSYEQQVVVDTSGGSGNLLADVISTALATGLTDYSVVARQVHAEAVKALPFGKYHPRSGADGAERTVILEKQEAALAEGD